MLAIEHTMKNADQELSEGVKYITEGDHRRAGRIFRRLARRNVAEAMFKGFGRALAEAVAPDPRLNGAVPSSKGVLA